MSAGATMLSTKLIESDERGICQDSYSWAPLWSAAAWRRFGTDQARSIPKRRQAAALQRDARESLCGADQNTIIRIDPRRSVAGFRPVHFTISLDDQLIQCLSVDPEGRGAHADSDTCS